MALSDRHVRTPEGAQKFGKPIGARITKAEIKAARQRLAAQSTAHQASTSKSAPAPVGSSPAPSKPAAKAPAAPALDASGEEVAHRLDANGDEMSPGRQRQEKALNDRLGQIVKDDQSAVAPKHEQFDTWEKLEAQGKKIKAQFDAMLLAAGEKFGATSTGYQESVQQAKAGRKLKKPMVILAELKSKERATEKVEDRGGDWANLVDVVRGTLVVPTAAEVPDMVEALQGQLEGTGWQLKEVRNGFGDPPPDWNVGEHRSGYRDFKAMLVSPDGMNTELQIHTASIYAAKGLDGHDWYVKMRSLMASAKDRDYTPEELAELDSLQNRSLELYRKAFQESFTD